MVCTIRLICIPFIQLIEIDNFGLSVCETDIAERCNGRIAVGKPLEHTVTEKKAQIICVIISKFFLLGSEVKHLVSKIGFSVVGNGIDDPFLYGGCYGFCFDLFAGGRIHRNRNSYSLNRAFLFLFCIGIEFILALTEHIFHIRNGNGGVVFVFGCTVLTDK